MLGKTLLLPFWPGGNVNVKPGCIGDEDIVVAGVVVKPELIVGRRSQETPAVRRSIRNNNINGRNVVFIISLIISNYWYWAKT